MGTLISIVDYLETKVNDLAQWYRKLTGTGMEREIKIQLQVEGKELARRKMFQMRKENERQKL